jgi:hypothetical protein
MPGLRTPARPGLGRALRLVLLVQAALALLLLLADGLRWLPGGDPERDTLVTGPVSPGDQRRPYDPARGPGDILRLREGAPVPDLPDEFPPRLEITLEEDGDTGRLALLRGPVEPGDAARFEAFLAGLETPVAGVAVNSPGGVVAEALEIGRVIRAQGLATHVLPGAACFSSCPYIFAGGVTRDASRSGAIGLHQHYYDAPGYLPVFLAVEDIQQGQGRTMAYLLEMGIEPALMLHSLTTPPEAIYVLVEEELLSTRLATAMTE